MRLNFYENKDDIGFKTDQGPEVPEEFTIKYKKEMQEFLDIYREEKALLKKRKEKLAILKENFDLEIKMLHPEYFL